MGTEVDLRLDGKLDIAGQHDFVVSVRVAGGPFALTIRTPGTVSLSELWDTIREQIHTCFGVSLPSIDEGPWKSVVETRIQPSVWVTPDKSKGVSAYLDLDFSADPITVGGSADLGPVKVTITPDFTVSGLLIGYDAKAGLNLKARVSYETDKGKKAKALTDGSPAKGKVDKLVEYPFPLPAQNSGSSFKVRYLGIGQRVGPNPVTDPSVTDPLATIFADLEREFDTNDPTEMLTRLAREFYHPDRGWFIAADIEVRGFTLRVLFNDPALYGLEIKVGSDPKTFFSGLLFEILYQKLGPQLGVYYGALTLPDSMRRIPMEGFVLILPGFSIWVYTNGDFRVNIGWPVGPNSIGVSVELLTGWAGIYFAKLRSSDNPGAQPSTNYNPILELGIGFQLSAGVSLSAGPLSASLSAKATTTMQGLVAWEAREASIGKPPDAYWFVGTWSLQVLLRGSVDFAVIKASVSIGFGFQASIAFENGYGTAVRVDAHVSAKASVKVLFVTVHFSFHTQVHYTFRIGSGSELAEVAGPRNPDLKGIARAEAVDVLGQHLRAAARLKAVMAPALRGEDMVLRPPRHLDRSAAPPATAAGVRARAAAAASPEPPAIDLHFALTPTVVYDGDEGTMQVVGLLLTDSPDPKASPQASPLKGTGFESLVAHLVCWLINDHAPPPGPDEPLSARLRALRTLLGQGGEQPRAPFHDALGFARAMKDYFADNLTFRIEGVSSRHTPAFETGTLLPMFDDLAMTFGDASIDFATLNPTPSNYPEAISDYFDGLGLLGGKAPGAMAAEAMAASPPSGPSVASFVFADFYLMLMRQVIGGLIQDAEAHEREAREALRAAAPEGGPPPTEAVGAYLAATDHQSELDRLLRDFDYANAAAFSARFLLGGLRLPVPNTVPGTVTPEIARGLPTEALYRLTGQQQAVPDPGSPPGASARLGYGEGGKVDWIAFADGDGTSTEASVDLPASPPPAPVPEWVNLTARIGAAAAGGAAGNGRIAYTPVPPLARVDLAYTTRRQTRWNAPDGDRVVVPFPAPLLAKAGGGPALYLRLHKSTGDGARRVADTAADAKGAAALVFRVPVAQVEGATVADIGGAPDSPASPSSPGGSPAGPGVLPNVYRIGATDDESRERVYQAIQDTTGIARVDILYPDSGGKQLASAELADDVLMTRTNLSTENQAKEVTAFALRQQRAKPRTDIAFAPVSDPKGFLQLLWEVSVVNAEGFYLHYRTADGHGLPDHLFQDSAPKKEGQGEEPVPDSSGFAGELTFVVTFEAAETETVPVSGSSNAVVSDAAGLAGSTVTLEVLDADKNPLSAYHSAFDAGDVGFRLDWSGKAEAEAAAGTIDVGELYHLIQFQVTSAVGTSAHAWSLPLNPLAPDSGDSDAEAAPKAEADTQVFRQVFPAYRFLGQGSPDTGSPSPSPVASPGGGNWYDLVGAKVDLAFRLTDIFGNALAPHGSVSQTGVYHDPIVNLGQWPLVDSVHWFEPGQGGSARLRVALRFDTAGLTDLSGSPASPSSPSGSGEKDRLEALAETYRTIAYQLGDPGTQYTLTTSLAKDGRVDDDPRDGLAGFVEAIRDAIADAIREVEEGTTASSPPQPITADIDTEVPLSDIAALPANIGTVKVGLTARRDPARAAPDAAERLPAVISSCYDVPPRRKSGGTGSRTTAAAFAPQAFEKTDLKSYARDFEAAFADFDGKNGMLKLAERAGVVANDAAQSVDTLWFVRFAGDGSGDSGGIHAAFEGALTYYALRPLNTAPHTQTVDGTTYNGIDMDAWAADFFDAVDGLFEPRMATAIALLDERDGTDRLGRLSRAKTMLAKTVPTGLSVVLQGDKPGDAGAAREALEQALLDKLSHAFTVSVVAQASAKVTVVGAADDGSPAPERPPQLYGKVGVPEGGSPVSREIAGDAGDTKVFTISPGRLDIAEDTEWSTLLVSVAEPEEHVNLRLPLTFDVSYVQHDFETDEMQGGYVPSSWLKFALPRDPTEGSPCRNTLTLPVTGDREAVIPIPLPFEPPVPTLSGQRARGARLDGGPASPDSPDSLSKILHDALLWTYEVALTAPLAAQDTLFFNVAFNGKGDADTTRAGDKEGPRALFEKLARFRAAQPAFRKAIPAILDDAYRRGGASPGASASPAESALEDIMQAIENVAGAWPDRSLGLERMAVMETPAEIVEYRLTIIPSQDETSTTLHLGARKRGGDSPDEAPDTWPTLRAEAASLDWTPDPEKAVADDGWWTVSHEIAATEGLSDLTLSWTDLDMRRRQSGFLDCHVVRNAELVPDRTTNEAFIYETAAVSFSTVAIPLITRTNLPTAKADRPLKDLLEEILRPLAPRGTGLEPTLNFRVDFSYALVGDGDKAIRADIPILVLEDLSLDDGSNSPEKVAGRVAGAIADWHAGFHGVSRGARLAFGIDLFGVVEGQQLPLVQLHPLTIDVSDVSPSWWENA